ncbi:glycosyltransferase family protein [Lachnobacterium bovis]|uniref:glycosyltransferase family protein n=1 Tax=Lachnobacterium bovis TaxID=140626 RepID=UPI0003B7A178|nr:DUF3880 domain-containing protein [Lachnobacterium bovis]
MKMLFYRYGSICEDDIIKTFEEFGIEIIEYDREVYDKRFPVEREVLEIAELLDGNNILFVFSINFFPYLSEIAKIYKIRYVTWVVDSPVLELYTKEIKNDNNRIFIFDRQLKEEIAKYNEKCVFHLPLGARVEEKEKIFEEKRKFKHEVSFVGSLYTEKNPISLYEKNIPDFYRGYLAGISDMQEWCYGTYMIDQIVDDDFVLKIKKYMNEFEDVNKYEYLTDRIIFTQYYMGAAVTAKERVDTFKMLSKKYNVDLYTLSDTSCLPKVNNCGQAKTKTQMPRIFYESKININTTSKAIRTGVPLRVFDILSCKGFVLSNYQTEVLELFPQGEVLDVYVSLENLEEKIEYYMLHEKERNEIAENGYEFLKKNYSMAKQLTKMLAIAFDI